MGHCVNQAGPRPIKKREKRFPVLQELQLAESFELEFPNKRAYRYKDGQKLQTAAFKEYLILKT